MAESQAAALRSALPGPSTGRRQTASAGLLQFHRQWRSSGNEYQTHGGAAENHEIYGVGAEVRTVKRGDVVIAPFAISDGTWEGVPDGYRAMHEREAIKVTISF